MTTTGFITKIEFGDIMHAMSSDFSEKGEAKYLFVKIYCEDIPVTTGPGRILMYKFELFTGTGGDPELDSGFKFKTVEVAKKAAIKAAKEWAAPGVIK